ncbi:hypothetical protein AB4Z25_13245 [Rhizobium sp. RAF36]
MNKDRFRLIAGSNDDPMSFASDVVFMVAGFQKPLHVAARKNAKGNKNGNRYSQIF